MKIQINAHSSIRIESDKVIYFDPFKIEGEMHDADIVCITHTHFDHFSPEDIQKIIKGDTLFVLPAGYEQIAEDAGIPAEMQLYVSAGMNQNIRGVEVLAVPAYNQGKKFHPKKNGWLGYVIQVEEKRIYVMGDTDATPDARKVACDICMIPIGGKYTMNYEEAAEYIREIRPEKVIPTHYGCIVGEPDDGMKFKELVGEETVVELLL